MNYTNRKKIIVSFSDLIGSSRWSRRMAEHEEKRHEFMAAFDKESLLFKERTEANFYKRLGDGRMFVHDIPHGKESEIALRLLLEMVRYIKRVNSLISKLTSPRLAGIRMRQVACQLQKEVYSDGQEDFFGYGPSACHEFLKIKPEIPIIVHESVIDLITLKKAKKKGLAFKLIQDPNEYPDKVDKEDVNSLYEVIQEKN